MNNRSWSDSLDELLDELNNGTLNGQSLSDFQKNLYAKNKTKPSEMKKDNLPYVNEIVDNTTYHSRHMQIVRCLNSIVYHNYPESKQNGHKQAIERYLQLAEKDANNLKELDNLIVNDLDECKRMLANNTEDYSQGYYDALVLVKKVLFKSKLARLKELSGKVNN